MKQKRHFNMKTVTALIIATFAYASMAHAKPSADLTVVLLESPGQPVCNLEIAEKVIDGATQQVAPAATIRTNFISIPHPFPVLQVYGQQSQLARALLQFAKQNPALRNKRVHFLTPALVGPAGEYYSYELASSSCKKAAVSVGSCIEYNDLGQVRVIASVFAMAHGVLHGMGATHLEGEPNIMSRDALPYSVETEFLPVRKKTKKQVRACLRK